MCYDIDMKWSVTKSKENIISAKIQKSTIISKDIISGEILWNTVKENVRYIYFRKKMSIFPMQCKMNTFELSNKKNLRMKNVRICGFMC